jgi:hypothetical protein
MNLTGRSSGTTSNKSQSMINVKKVSQTNVLNQRSKLSAVLTLSLKLNLVPMIHSTILATKCYQETRCSRQRLSIGMTTVLTSGHQW